MENKRKNDQIKEFRVNIDRSPSLENYYSCRRKPQSPKWRERNQTSIPDATFNICQGW